MNEPSKADVGQERRLLKTLLTHFVVFALSTLVFAFLFATRSGQDVITWEDVIRGAGAAIVATSVIGSLVRAVASD